MYSMGDQIPQWEWEILRGKGRPIVTYMDTLLSSEQKRMTRSRCRFGRGIGRALGIMC